jgi:gluconate 2-dehydrogenase gamma chain
MTLFTADVPAWLQRPAKGYLTPAEIAQVDAIFSRILPADHARQIPGAVEAGASSFVSELLAMDAAVYWEIPNWRTLYRAALPALDDYARANFQAALVALTDDQMNSVIGGLEAGSLAGFSAAIDQKLLFTTLRRHCIQGSFADPRWGGNKNNVMWRGIGYLQPAEDLYHDNL